MMDSSKIKHCPGTLAAGFNTYSQACLNRVFFGKTIHHVLPYDSPLSDPETNDLFEESRQRISISGVQEKFSVLFEKNKLRLVKDGERGSHILKPIPSGGKKADQMPANEHLTMQIARQVYAIDTADNALIFFKNGAPAYITRRFDVTAEGMKLGQDDFASLAGRTPQTHGEHYKYLGNFFDLFQIMEKSIHAYTIEAPKLLRILMFNYLFSNGDAHLKNFSVLETPMGDYRLSPAYDLLNSRIHINDREFALDDGLLPKNLSQGKIRVQFSKLSQLAGISDGTFQRIYSSIVSGQEIVERMVASSFLDDTTKRNYWQSYRARLKQLLK